jgi:hypothetical protein
VQLFDDIGPMGGTAPEAVDKNDCGSLRHGLPFQIAK